MKPILIVSWVALPLLALVALIVRETTRPSSEPVAQGHAAPLLAEQKPLSTAALALAFGYSEPGGPAAKSVDLVLKACFVSSGGHARALVATREGQRLYRVGDRLPSGSVLRRIDARSIALWDGGREQIVALTGSSNIFVQSGSAVVRSAAPADSPRLLREVQ